MKVINLVDHFLEKKKKIKKQTWIYSLNIQNIVEIKPYLKPVVHTFCVEQEDNF